VTSPQQKNKSRYARRRERPREDSCHLHQRRQRRLIIASRGRDEWDVEDVTEDEGKETIDVCRVFRSVSRGYIGLDVHAAAGVQKNYSLRLPPPDFTNPFVYFGKTNLRQKKKLNILRWGWS
jgi:hypothetical protein